MVESRILTDDDLNDINWLHIALSMKVPIDTDAWVQDMQNAMDRDKKIPTTYDLNHWQKLSPDACYCINEILLSLDNNEIEYAVLVAKEHIHITGTGISMLKRLEHHPYYEKFYEKFKNIEKK